MPAIVGAERVPEHLGVVMGMAVDEAGCDDMALGVDDLLRAFARQIADGGNDAVPDADIGAETGQARTVHHRAAPD